MTIINETSVSTQTFSKLSPSIFYTSQPVQRTRPMTPSLPYCFR